MVPVHLRATSGIGGSVTRIATMHEEMDDRAEQQEHIRKRTKDVRPVLLPQKECGDAQKEAEPKPHR